MNPNNKKSLILGFGNLDREDDGVAWHILSRLAGQFQFTLEDCPEEAPQSIRDNLDILFLLQLSPELAETIANYDRVCFVDAHTGAIPETLHMAPVEACFQASPLTHHITPQTIMCLTHDIYNATPEAILVSVRGYQFEFHRQLSTATDQLANQAVIEILKWVNP
jgi:hydrogenase maturation protease